VLTEICIIKYKRIETERKKERKREREKDVAMQFETLHISKENSKIIRLRSFTRGVRSSFWLRQIGGRVGK
jgi:hypothetical protein